MKKLFLILFMLASSAMAQEQEVIVSVPPGNFLDLMCRNVMESYDKLYGTKSVILNVPGADQSLGHKAFLTNTKAKFLCAGNSLIGLNQKILPDTSPSYDSIRPVVGLVTLSQFVFTPVNHPDTMAGLIKRSKETNKPILVGGFSHNSTRLFTMYLEKSNAKYELVLYKNPAESLVSLREGTLDVYVDSGTIKPLLDQYPYVKEIAHVAPVKRSNTENLYDKVQPHGAGLITGTNIYLRADATDEEVNFYNKRFNNAINSENTKSFYKNRIPFHTPINSTVKDAEKRSKAYRDYLDKYYVPN
jgi:tripartite-type tricarboxylate transporter receptor subunit TctC